MEVRVLWQATFTVTVVAGLFNGERMTQLPLVTQIEWFLIVVERSMFGVTLLQVMAAIFQWDQHLQARLKLTAMATMVL